MPHYVLTGATGLLGAYLLRDLLRAGHEVTVLVRPTRMRSAEERIDMLFKHWEPLNGLLPRPKVISGNVIQPHLGLDRTSRQWVARNCDAVVHSAASLKFRETDGEPWTTNLTGTQEVLRFVTETRLSAFHYISTAYVCGQTDGIAYELPIAHDVLHRNVYEKSKFQAEQLVLEANLPQPPTILRPSIIIGDSQTGYTSTFHGVYLPLRQAVALQTGGLNAGAWTPEATPDLVLNPLRILQLMGLTGLEKKNLVAVDWVSRMICRVITNPHLHGNIYHLTTPEPTSVERLTRVTVQCVLEAMGLDGKLLNLDLHSSSELDETFCSLLSVYQEYWMDDPTFDSTGLSLILANEPPPTITDDVLLRTFRYAIQNMSQPTHA
jgi:nucleoside-diphosphate-sugar epimerase